MIERIVRLAGTVLFGLAALAATIITVALTRDKARTVPMPEALPTFVMSPRLRADIEAADGRKPYVCREAILMGPVEIATCADCMLFPIDKIRALPATYEPDVVPTGLSGGGQIRRDVKGPLKALFDAAKKSGYTPYVTSAYRSYEEQIRTFETWVAVELQSTTNRDLAIQRASVYSAWPGHSEHQLGTAVDVNCAACRPFDENDVRNRGLWRFLANNAHRFGFVISYPADIEALTGYRHEPWHIRYIGIERANTLYEHQYLDGNGVCLTAFLRDQVR